MDVSDALKTNNSFYHEENTVNLDGCAQDLLQFREHCNSLRDIIRTSWKSKKSNEAVNASQFATYMIGLKELNRRTQFRIRKARDITNQKKSRLDQLHLSLQNLLYEVAHLEGEIQTCLDFKSRHKDMNLIPVDEFYQNSKTKLGTLSEHQETLERLYWEIEQRKALSKSCEEVKSSVQTITQRIESKKQYLNSFGPKIKEIIDNTLIVQELMGLPFTKEDNEYKLAFLLPEPLYILYAHLKSYISMSEQKASGLNVTIEGDMEMARGIKQSTDQNSQSAPDDSDVEDQEGNNKNRSKRRCKGKQQNEKLESLNFHPLTVLLTITVDDCPGILKPSSFSINLSFAWILKLNLITVRLTFPNSKHKSLLSQSKTANDLLYSEQLLANLPCKLNSDDLVTLISDEPILIHQSKFSATGSHRWNACDSIGRPYSWIQQLVGLNCLPERSLNSSSLNRDVMSSSADPLNTSSCSATDVEMNSSSAATDKMGIITTTATTTTSNYQNDNENRSNFGLVESLLKAIQSRLTSRLYLLEELTNIEQSNLCLSPEQKQLIPSTTGLQIMNWERSSFEQLKLFPRAQVLIALNVINESDIVFRCLIGHNPTSAATVWIALPQSYPNDAPILMLDNVIAYVSSSDSQEGTEPKVTDLSEVHCQELELEINCYLSEFFNKHRQQTQGHSQEQQVKPDQSATKNGEWTRNILSCQLARCMCCVQNLCQDQLTFRHSLKLTNGPCSSGSETTSTTHPTPPPGVRNVKYPTRSRPMCYLPTPGAFIHRL